MADLTFTDKKTLETLFQMGGGYVLDFSNRTFQEFVTDAVQKNIYDGKYVQASGSKAHCLRGFWQTESNHVVGSLIEQMANYAITVPSADHSLVPHALTIAKRLKSSASVSDIDAITASTDSRTFEALAKSVREAIDSNAPETGLDRLHTFVVKYLRHLCASKEIKTEKTTPLHNMFGMYRNYLNQNGLIQSKMTDRILKLSVETLDAFNNVRNEKSLAHDNEILNYDESLFIFNHVCALVRLLQTIEKQIESVPPSLQKDVRI